MSSLPQNKKKKTDHQRVLEILHRVDLTAEQRLANQELRDAVLDAEDSVCMLEQQLRIHQLNNDCVAAIQVAQQRLRKFETEISYAHSTTRQEDEQYARECGLLVDGNLFLSEETRLTSLRGIDIARDRLLKLYPDSELAKSFKEGALAVLDQCETVAIEHKLDTSPWASVMESALHAVASMVHENSGALEPLKAIDAKIQKLRQQADREVALQHEAIEAGDVAQSEEHVKARMALLEGVSALIQQKFKVLSQIEEGPLVKAHQEAKKAQEQLSKAAIEVFERQDKHLENLETDCDRLEEFRDRGKQNEKEARTLFLEQRSQSDKFLAENLEKQTHCWKELLRIEAQLSALAEERREEVERRVRGFEREERRRSDMGHFVNFADSRQKQLTKAIDNIITEKRVGGALADVVDKAVFTLSQEVAVMQNAVKETKKAMLEEHAGHFRDQYLTVGELLFRKERLLEECDKKIVELRMQQEIAMDTLDPKARLISEQRASFEQQREEVLSFVNLLKAKAESYIESFRPSDAAIRSTTGIATSFNATEAMEELRKQNESRSRALDQYFTHMTIEAVKSEDALGRAKPNNEWRHHPKLMATDAEIEMERAEIAATKDLISQHRRKTLFALQSQSETDPRIRAKKYLSRRLSTTITSGTGGDGSGSGGMLSSDDEKTASPLKRRASTAGITRKKVVGISTATPDDENDEKKKNNNPPQTPEPSNNNKKRTHHQQDDTLANGYAQGTINKRNTLARKLNKALRVSALNLNDTLEPYEGRAMKEFEPIREIVKEDIRRTRHRRKRNDKNWMIRHGKEEVGRPEDIQNYDDTDSADYTSSGEEDEHEHDDEDHGHYQDFKAFIDHEEIDAAMAEFRKQQPSASPRKFKPIEPDPHVFDDFKISITKKNIAGVD